MLPPTWNFKCIALTCFLVTLGLEIPGLTLQRESSYFTSSVSEKVRGRKVPPSSIIFVGDSVIRYQYLSLVYFLKNRRWVGRHQRPNPIEEQTYDSWEDFYNQTSKMLTPYELCDCFRVDHPENFTLPYENRYFCGPGVKVSYIQAFGDFGSQGRYVMGSICERKGNDSWRFTNWSDTILFYLRGLSLGQETWIVLGNPTWPWPTSFQDEYYRVSVASRLRDIGVKWMWRTATYQIDTDHAPVLRRSEDVHVDRHMCALADACLNVSWTKRVGPSEYWDDKHFKAPIYRRMNLIMGVKMRLSLKRWSAQHT